MMKHLKSLLPSIIIALLVAGGANAALYQWSKTAGSNATADPSINFSEGMSPSSVNDSARALMARVAEWRDDLSGLLLTTGTSTAYVVATNQGLPTIPNDGQALAFTVHTDSGAAPTLRADGGTIYPIQSAAGVAIGAGVLVSGAPYTVKFKLASTAWVLHGFYGEPFVIPLGAMIDYTGDTSPNSNFVLPFGQCISRTTYSTYFALVSTRYGVCDGATTFGVPDFRGTIAVGKDNMGGTSRSLITTANSGCDGSTIGTQCGAATIGLLQTNIPAINFATSVSGTPTGSISVSTPSGSVSVSTPTGTVSLSDTRVWAAKLTLTATGSETSQATGANTPAGGNFTQQVSVVSGSLSGSFTGNALSAGFTGNAASGSFTGNSLTSTGSAASGGIGTPVQKLPPIQVVQKLLRIF